MQKVNQHMQTLKRDQHVSFSVSLFILMMLMLSSLPVHAAPFSTCPSKAFLFQSKPVLSYGVNLVTGDYELIEDDAGIDANINGLGFDEFDRYLYGFNTTHLNVVRMNSDFQVETLNVSGLPSGSFFVGDVTNHHYYIYRKGVGLYKIDLNALDEDVTAPLSTELITNQANVTLTDMAFHPNDGMLYGVDNKTGDLYQIDPDTGSSTLAGDTGETGTFGAMYFDVNGYFYLSRNQDGKIYRIDLSALTESSSESDLTSLDVSAEPFAQGPISNQNDGARCASAPLIDVDTPSTIDFGDAPATYKTVLDDNGPRHLLDGHTFLGLLPPDGDYDGYVGADSDDSSLVNGESYDDEDGVNFVTSFEVGLDSVVSVYASRSGILSAWFDWNRDGDFDDLDEQGVVDLELSPGLNVVAVRVPDHAVAGSSWSRFRFSQQSGLSFTGGSSSGEVEDHSFTISESGLTYRYYPGEGSWVTLAYEDQWPVTDDYDMNDVVLRYRTVEVVQNDSIVRVDIIGELQALGADYHNGFAVQLENVLPSNVNQQTLRLMHNNIKQQYSGTNGATTYPILESDTSNAVLVISQDLWDQTSSVCNFYRTEDGCEQAQLFDFELSIPFITAIPVNSITAPYDPFIFATESLYHGEGLGLHPGRALEIHLVDKAPTEKFNSDYFGLEDDTSNPEIGRYYRNENNLPWALELTEQWSWPSEKKPIILAYPSFQNFVESSGDTHSQWFELSEAISTYLF